MVSVKAVKLTIVYQVTRELAFRMFVKRMRSIPKTEDVNHALVYTLPIHPRLLAKRSSAEPIIMLMN